MRSIVLALLLSTLILSNCGSKNHLRKLESGKVIDVRLAGVWEGSEVDQQIKDAKKEWVMTRNEDGTFELQFTMTRGDRVRSWKEDGLWWVENGLFNELHTGSGKTDLYKYKVLDRNRIQFTAHSLSVTFNSEAYTFIDTRVTSKK